MNLQVNELIQRIKLIGLWTSKTLGYVPAPVSVPLPDQSYLTA